MHKFLNKDFYKNISFFFIFFFLFFSNYFFLGTTVPAYFLAIFLIFISIKSIKFNLNQCILLLLLLLYFVAIIQINDDIILSLKNIRYYFGFLIFIFLFRINKFIIRANAKYLRVIFLFIILESICINFFLNSNNLYINNHPAIFLDFYQRPSSFGGVASITSSLIICFFYFFEKQLGFKYNFFDFLLLILSVILLFSLTGFIMLAIMFFCRFFNLRFFIIKNVVSLIFFLFLILFLIYLSSLIPANIDSYGSYINYEKISLEYFFYTLSHKYNSFLYSLNNFNLFSMQTLIGEASTLGIVITSGDNGIFGIYVAMGLIGFVLFFSTIYFFKEKNNAITIFLLIISSFHYPVIMSPVGQLFTAFVITFNNQRYKINYHR
jgi:hypothetical protein